MQNELYHVGIKGMRWGHRKSPQTNNTQHASAKSTDEQKAKRDKMVKKLAAGTVVTLTVAAAAVYAANPKVRGAVNSSLSKVGKKSVSSFQKAGNKSVEIGKKVVKESWKSTKEGLAEGLKEAPKKAAKAIVVGAGMNAAKRMLDKSVGKEEAARIFKANNSKKIDSFWKVSPEDKEDD